MLPGHPEPHEYRIEQTNMYNVHNRCVPSFKVGRILLAADAAAVNNPMGGYGCMKGILDAGGLADCLIGYHQGQADESILDLYAQVRRDFPLQYIDKRSAKNLIRCATADPWTVLGEDPLFKVIEDLTKDKGDLKAFLLKESSIEYDFTKPYQHAGMSDEKVNGKSNVSDANVAEVQMQAEAA